jgi:hypothetical protein
VIRRRLDAEPAVGEVTPRYLLHPRAPERVSSFDPALKLVAILRDPVDRAYSQYQMRVRQGDEPLTFEDALEREEVDYADELQRMQTDPTYTWPRERRRSYVARGRYAEQLERWLRFFSSEQLLVLTSEELWSEPVAVLERLGAFLGVPPWPDGTYPRPSSVRYEPMPAEVRERLARTFEPHNRRLEQLLGRELPWTRPDAVAPIDPAASRA